MEVKAITKYLRISPKKTRLVANVIRNLSVNAAENQLKFFTRKASHFIAKTLKSAVANAEHNYGLKKDNLYIKKISINEGPSLKRWTPKAFGRATPIKRRTSHIEIILDEIKPSDGKKKKRQTIFTQKVEAIPKISGGAEISSEGKPVPVEMKTKISEKVPEIFDQRRKAGRRTKQHRDKLGLRKAGGVLKRIFRRKTI